MPWKKCANFGVRNRPAQVSEMPLRLVMLYKSYTFGLRHLLQRLAEVIVWYRLTIVSAAIGWIGRNDDKFPAYDSVDCDRLNLEKRNPRLTILSAVIGWICRNTWNGDKSSAYDSVKSSAYDTVRCDRLDL